MSIQQGRSGWTDGDDFSNNFISDLAPLLALFGEQVAKQFMSESMGWADDIIFAMGPLGIITAIVGAIRVGGPSWLKAIIGRARENRAVAEVELMSSTSHEVCELWNGQHIVRILGSPEVKELIHISKGIEDKQELGGGAARLYTLGQNNVMKEIKDLNCFQWVWQVATSKIVGIIPQLKVPNQSVESPPESPTSSTTSRSRSTAKKQNPIAPSAPNISVNIHNRVGRGELYIVAAIGIILQFSVLIYDGFATYHPRLNFQKEGSDVAAYAFPLTAFGTLLLVAGMLVCSYVVEHSTKEKTYQAENENGNADFHILWLQKVAVVGDQEFDSYAIFAKDKRRVMTTSRRHNQGNADWGWGSTTGEFLTIVGTIVSLLGFFGQFIGLRGMHWSATIAQLGVTLVMTILRAWVRRGLAKSPQVQLLPPTHELDWLATRIAEDENQLWGEPGPTSPPFWSRIRDLVYMRSTKHESQEKTNERFWSLDCFEWGIVTGNEISGYGALGGVESDEGANRAHKVMEARRNLGWLTQWPGAASDNALSVATAIEIVMNTLFTSGHNAELCWSMNSLGGQVIRFRVSLSNGKWKADVAQIEATLSLWLYSVHEGEQVTYMSHENNASNDKSAWLRSGVTSKQLSLRLLGESTASSLRDMKWWMGSGVSEVSQVELCPTEVDSGAASGKDDIIVANHRIVGFSGRLRTPEQSGSAYEQSARVYRVQPFPEDAGNDMSAPEQEETISESPNLEKIQPSLAAISDAPLGLLFAQDMFSAFMWAVAKSIDQETVDLVMGSAIVQKIERITQSNKNAWQSFTLQNTTLSRVVQGVQRTGLGSLNEIYMSMIPPLSTENKLPYAGSAVLLCRDEARKQELAGHWVKAGKINLWAFRTCAAFRTDSRIVTKAAIALIEFIRTLSIIAQDRVGQRRTVETFAELEGVRSDLITELKKFVSQICLSQLAGIYEMQGRTEGYDEWKPTVLDMARRDSSHSYLIERTDIHRAIIDSNRRKSYRLIQGGTHLEEYDIFGWTPLHYAVAFENDLILSRILKHDVDPHPADDAGWTPLHYAAWIHDVNPLIGQLLLQARADPQIQGRDGTTPLHCAAIKNNVGIAGILVKSRARLEIADNARRTPLHWAAYSGSEGVVDLLLEQGVNRDLPDEYGRTPLHLAASKGHGTVIKKFLGALDRSENTEELDYSPIALLVAKERDEAVIKIMMEVKDQDGLTALHEAAKNGHEEAVKVLLESGANIEAKDGGGWTTLHLAAKNGMQRIVEVLLAANADIQARGSDGQTPLQSAAIEGHEAVVRHLLDAGADIEGKNERGLTALHLVVEGEKQKMVSVLLELCANIEAQDGRGMTPLQLAVCSGNRGLLKMLLRAGADIKMKDKYGMTALHFAASRESMQIMKVLLLEESVDINVGDNDGETPLYWAARCGTEEMVKIILEAGADKSLINKTGNTAMDIAISKGYDEVVKLLL